MASPVIRGRIALGALVVAIAFVIVGFLRADREMMRVEEDRATATVSESATLVEVFLLRQLAQLRSVERLIAEGSFDAPESDNYLRRATSDLSNSAVTFDGLWIIDSTARLRTITLRDRRDLPLDTSDIINLVRHRWDREPFVLVRGDRRQPPLLFIETMENPKHQAIVGVRSPDSLVAMLDRQQRRRPAR